MDLLFNLCQGAEKKQFHLLKNVSTIPPVSQLIEQGLSPEEITVEVLGEDKVKLLETMDVQFNCTCSHERIENALISLGKEEIRTKFMQKKESGSSLSLL